MKQTPDKETPQKSSYRDSLKSMDTEETIDLWFYRPIGYMWACLARRLGVTPNAITIASIFLGVAAGILMYYADLWVNVAGMLLLVWANSFDSADGQLARMTKQYSRLGRILDGLSGDLWFVSIYFSICFRTNATDDLFSPMPWLIWTIAIVAGLCHAKQAAMADYYRNFHLYFLKGKEGSELDSSAQLKEKYAQLSWKKEWWPKLVLVFYINYTKSQEDLTPAMQRLRAALHKRWSDTPDEKFRQDFRMKSLPLMKYTNMLSFNTRVIALFVSLFIGMPWLYFAFELTVLNLMLVYMVLRHEWICKHFIKELEDGRY
ncbi:MAG: CDP-alcohol phosphatidyltransferase family protein [Muribaculaceae bacterium]|jgi:hypothetical protein|nr:CDP-alcohol phosphatidyltransferase family protein [Muribaculaceae bacterium]